MQIALAVLLDSATLDGWSSALYTGMYGCAQFSSGDPSPCDLSAVSVFAMPALVDVEMSFSIPAVYVTATPP